MDKNNGAIYDARKLEQTKDDNLGIQHMFVSPATICSDYHRLDISTIAYVCNNKV